MSRGFECFPPFGVYQGVRADSAAQLGAAAVIAHANAINFFAHEGLDHTLLEARERFGITYCSQNDSYQARDALTAGGFKASSFRAAIDALPAFYQKPPVLTASACLGQWNKPRFVGIKLNQNHILTLKLGAEAIQQEAFRLGGAALPVRSSFSHISLLRYGKDASRPALTKRQSNKLKSIASDAKAEVGLEEIFFGRLVVGADIDTPLPEEAFAI